MDSACKAVAEIFRFKKIELIELIDLKKLM